MNKKLFAVLVLAVLALSSFAAHKFYMSIYQIDFAPEKKRLQITSRVFIDDLNQAVGQQFHQKTHIGEKEEGPQDEALLQSYFTSHFSVKVNGQAKSMQYLSKERDENVVVCYFRITDVPKVISLEVTNSALTELYPDQQNMIQAKVGESKQTLLLQAGQVKGMLKF